MGTGGFINLVPVAVVVSIFDPACSRKLVGVDIIGYNTFDVFADEADAGAERLNRGL